MNPASPRSLARLSGLILAVVLLTPSLFSAERESLKLLAIGNSFSDDATRLLPQVVKAAGKELIIGRASIGGCPLERHARHLKEAESGNPNGHAYKGATDPKTGEKRDMSLPELLSAQAWDVVTIQQWSQLSFKPETFQPFADELIAAIHKYAPTAEIVVHQTWAYREDHDWFKKDDGFTPAKMYTGLTSTYKNFADGKGFRVLPVGDALNLARQTPRWTYVTDPNFDFKNPPAGQLPDQRTSLNIGWHWKKNKAGATAFTLDAIHCNPAGQYLGANVWYSILYQTDTLPDSYAPIGMTAEDAADLRAHALTAVKAERAREAALHPVVAK
ncbi:DUF4886 domain-containing protein [Rariglobus hedericola]|uniref:DUF4886 domain-containing protein n=1 Tax=Rariglobus hedericola TaxID=2597822 RepID=A0A556QRV0_9BACT|nr:DUF4886 domain-containing protein [Rariglobus hedericola]TSJ79353.1 DUF4886 domain-containing protein [Rariglobus hedericola]